MSGHPPEQQRERGHRSESWEDRFPRYAHNAEVTARFAAGDAARQRKAAELHSLAAGNARKHGDVAGAGLYEMMSEAALGAADALDYITRLARQVAVHYTREPA